MTAGRSFTGLVVALLLACALSTVLGTALGLANFRDVAYPDSATLLRVQEAVTTGNIYPDINRPPYLVSIYGPLCYWLLAIPYRLAQAFELSPQIFVRVGIVIALSVCMMLVFLISRLLHGSRSQALLSSLFAVSVLPLASWSTQIRGDFLALQFSLLSVYWLRISGGRRRAVLAPILAAVALLVKATFIAAPLAAIGWLVYLRRYKDAVRWSAVFAITLAAGYGFTWWREPLMLQHLSALRHPVFEYKQASITLVHALAQPVFPMALIGASLRRQANTAERKLILFFWIAAWLVAIGTIPQAGGNINYFWEPLFLSAVFAGRGLSALQSKVNRASNRIKVMFYVPALAGALFLTWHEAQYWQLCYRRAITYQADGKNWQSLISIVAGKKVLSTLPDVTIHSAMPEIPDPYLNTVLEMGGQWSYRPVIRQIAARVFDVIIVSTDEARARGDDYRGLKNWDDGMWAALSTAYQRTCVLDRREEVWLPRRDAAPVAAELRELGCVNVYRPAPLFYRETYEASSEMTPF